MFRILRIQRLGVSEAYYAEETWEKLGKDRTHDAHSHQEIDLVFKVLPQVVAARTALAEIEREAPQLLQATDAYVASNLNI